MGKGITESVIEKAYHPPPGAPDKYWCYLLVETESGARVNVRIHQKNQDRITVGDRMGFKPWRKNKRVRNVQVVGRA